MDKEFLINKYFEQSLTTQEKLEFEQLLLTNKDFASAFAFEKSIKRAILLNERTELKQKLKSFDKSKSIKPLIFRWYYLAASIFLVAGISLWLFSKQNSEEQLFKTYYHTYPNTIVPTIRGKQTEEIKNRAFTAYDNGDYKSAVKYFDQIYKTEHFDYALFYKALSLMELKEYKHAKEELAKFDLTKKNDFKPLIKWYLALTYLQTNEKENAIGLLKDLSKTENPMQEMAKKLLADLD